MAGPSNANGVPEGTTFVFGSWACTADGTGGFSSHLVMPLCAQGHHHQYEGASNVVGSKGDLKPKIGYGGFGGLAYKLK